MTSETTLPPTISDQDLRDWIQRDYGKRGGGTLVIHPGDGIFYLDILEDGGAVTETIPLFMENEGESRAIAFAVIKQYGRQLHTDVRFKRAMGPA